MEHITDIIDNNPFADLTDAELSTIQAHTSSCGECRQAFAAARLSSLLLRERTSEAAESAANANPFFQTRVLAAWRKQQATNGVSAFYRLWNATGALVASMAATTAALAVLTLVAPANDLATQQTAVGTTYSAEAVVLDDQADNQVTNDQVLSAVYDEDEGK